MSEYVRGDPFGLKRRAAGGRGVGVFADDQADRVAAERSALAGWEQRVVGLAVAFVEPCAQELRSRRSGRRACLAAFARDPDVRAGAEVTSQTRRPVSSETRTPVWIMSEQQRVVAAAEPGGAVGRGEERLDLAEVEVGDGVALVALGRDRHHPRDRVGVLGMLERGEPVEGVDRPEPGVAGPGAVARGLLEVVEEGADQRRVEIVEVQLEWLLAGLLVREGSSSRNVSR